VTAFSHWEGQLGNDELNKKIGGLNRKEGARKGIAAEKRRSTSKTEGLGACLIKGATGDKREVKLFTLRIMKFCTGRT